ncbi:MAG: GTPase Era [Syntrophobacteraceae bacterium]|jgi:GTP-binding protein Era|nr:GTPase Era [Syntrophobacteraceae bacterium]
MKATDGHKPFKSGYVALVGAPNVGKSTLLNQLLKEKVSITGPRPQTTRNRIAGILNRSDCQIILLDTPGIHKARDAFNQILVDTALGTLGEVDVICMIVDATATHREIDEMIRERLSRIGIPVVLLLNKVDLVRRKGDLLPMLGELGEKWACHAIIPISALNGDGVDLVLDELMELLPEGPRYYPEDDLTDQPERFLVGELVREKVFHLAHQEVPYAVAITVDRFSEDPERRRVEIEATIHVERDSQKAIIIGKQGQMLKEIGKQARHDIEALLGCHVFLGLYVRVQKNWRKDPRARADFGYRPQR